jgi:hypothetical protein
VKKCKKLATVRTFRTCPKLTVVSICCVLTSAFAVKDISALTFEAFQALPDKDKTAFLSRTFSDTVNNVKKVDPELAQKIDEYFHSPQGMEVFNELLASRWGKSSDAPMQIENLVIYMGYKKYPERHYSISNFLSLTESEQNIYLVVYVKQLTKSLNEAGNSAMAQRVEQYFVGDSPEDKGTDDFWDLLDVTSQSAKEGKLHPEKVSITQVIDDVITNKFPPPAAEPTATATTSSNFSKGANQR